MSKKEMTFDEQTNKEFERLIANPDEKIVDEITFIKFNATISINSTQLHVTIRDTVLKLVVGLQKDALLNAIRGLLQKIEDENFDTVKGEHDDK